MANVIREDVVKLDFQVEGLKEIQRLQKELNDLKKKFTGGVGDDAFDDLKKGANDTVKPLKNVKDQAEKVTKSLKEMGKKAATTAFNGLKKVAKISFKALAVGITGAATAVGALVKNAVSAYAEYEQLYGGMQTLLGAKGAKNAKEYAKITGQSVGKATKEYEKMVETEKTVMKNANNAFKTAGMSANQYMTTITSFSAALTTSLGGDTAKAAELADVAIRDMADNANKMGTPLESVTTVYSNLARGMYMTLDNLKLGYAGTKEGAKEMVNDAAKIDKSVKKNDLSYANLVKAIHAVQQKMDITGTTSKEAFGTITGSLNTFKGALGNLLPAMIQGGDELDQCIKNLVDSIVGFETKSGKLKGGLINNLMPAIEKALGGVGTLIEKLSPVIEKELPKLIDKLLPPLIKAATALLKGLIKSLPKIISTIVKELPDIFKQLGQGMAEAFADVPILGDIGKFFSKNATKIANGAKVIIPTIIALVAAFKGFKAIKSITAIFGKLKGGAGGGAGGKGGKGGIFSGLTNTFKELANTKTTTVLKGVANMSIILGALGALLWIMTKVFKNGINFKEMLQVTILIGALGAVGLALAHFAGIVGKIPIMTVVKGLANMAIIFVGTGAMLWALTKVFKNGINFKEMLQVVALIGILGTVGAVLSVFAGIVGLIPIPVVLSGLANMAIVLVGLGALLFAATKVFKNGVNFKEMITVISLIGILGTVGSVLSVFAGIVGLIPIPIVLAGLTNMGLVLGGMAALIVAFGELTRIQGFTEFLDKGGKVLVKIMNILGEMVGSLAGGLIEGLSSCLPTLGENLGTFGENIKPLFKAMKGVDMGGVAAFFTALVGLLGIATGNEIVQGIKSFFGGDEESALAKLGTDLCNFATNAQGFFNTVAGMEAAGFTNAKLMFESLASMKDLPKEGGIVGWFSGELNYTNIAAGLGQLASENVVKFFNTVAKLKQAGFDNAKLLFETLGGMKSLPKDGGVKGWFTGDINYEKIATGLGALADEGVKNFFDMVGKFKQKTFDNTKLLFETLGGIKSLPKEGGFWQNLGDAITGTETKSTLTVIADDLSNFGEKTSDFFAQINELNLGNLNGLWDSLSKAETLTASISKVVDDNINDIVEKISNLPQKMGDAIKQSGDSLGAAFVEMWKDAVEASVKPVNKLLSGANHILKEFGSEKRVIEWQPYAKGTDGHKGGNALVNDGRGAELIQMPNGRTFIPNGRNVFLPNAPKGMKVLPAEQTARLMGKSSPSFRYADGTGKIDVWSFFDNANGLVNKISEGISYSGMSAFTSNVGKGIVSTFKGEMAAWVEKLFEEHGGKSLESYVASMGVSQWRSTVIQALKMEGQYSAANVARTLYQMQTESGGNPRAINLWDSNAKRGIPSKGLMQVIDPTFKAYARKGFDKNIYDPLSNILASIRYATSRYGSLSSAYQGHGYSKGVGTVEMPERSINLSYTPESDSGYYTTNKVENNTYSPQFTVNISGTSDDRTMYRKIKRMIAEAWEEMLDDLEAKTPQTQQV